MKVEHIQPKKNDDDSVEAKALERLVRLKVEMTRLKPKVEKTRLRLKFKTGKQASKVKTSWSCQGSSEVDLR